MAESKKIDTEAGVKKEPVFMNKTKIDQVVYDKSNSAETIRPGKTVTGEWYRKYSGKRKSPLTLVEDPDSDKEKHPSTETDFLPGGKENPPNAKDETKGKVAKDDKNKSGADSKGKK